MGEIHTNEIAYKTKYNKLKSLGNLLDQRKIAFFNSIKSKEMTEIYKEFMQMKQIFIPKKFTEKIRTKSRKKIKTNEPHETKSTNRNIGR